MTFQEMQRKARFGHRTWIGYRDRDGSFQAARANAESIKRCLLSTGTQGRWYIVESDGVSMIGKWWIGINMINQFKRGWR